MSAITWPGGRSTRRHFAPDLQQHIILWGARWRYPETGGAGISQLHVNLAFRGVHMVLLMPSDGGLDREPCCINTIPDKAPVCEKRARKYCFPGLREKYADFNINLSHANTGDYSPQFVVHRIAPGRRVSRDFPITDFGKQATKLRRQS